MSIVALWKAMALGLLVTLFWDAPWVSHLVQDIRTWHGFFLSTQAGLVPYVDITKEYPVLGGALYWAMSPFVDADDLRQTVLVHGLFMLAADLLNTVLFYRLARGIQPSLALPATLLFGLNLTSLVMGPVRYEPFVTTFVLLGLGRPPAGPLRPRDVLVGGGLRPEVVPRVLHRRAGVPPVAGRGTAHALDPGRAGFRRRHRRHQRAVPDRGAIAKERSPTGSPRTSSMRAGRCTGTPCSGSARSGSAPCPGSATPACGPSP